jgi:4-amino-4-deoxychorismate mutase
MSAPGELESFRRRLDALDDDLLRVLGERFSVCAQIGTYKHENGIAVMQAERVRTVRARYRLGAEANRLPRDFVETLLDLLISATCKLEDELMATARRGPA